MSFELPPEQTGAAAWYGPEIAQAQRLADAAGGRRDRRDRGRPTARSPRATPTSPRSAAADFPLPTLAPSSRRGSTDEVLNGPRLPADARPAGRALDDARGGDGVLRPGRASRQRALAETARATCWATCQDLGLASNDPNVRIYQTHERQTFHTDSCDIVGLLCLKTAKSGGLSALVSSTHDLQRDAPQRPDC
jgi:hypothetical protein